MWKVSGVILVQALKERQVYSKMNIKHGMCHTRLYRIWQNMKTRCNNPNATRFNTWGGKGINVCEEWNDFEIFKNWAISNGYSDDLTLDRIDPNGNYEPDNCRWVTVEVQNINKDCVPKYEYQGITFCQSQVFELFGVKRTTFQSRLKRGLTVEEALKGYVASGQ